MLSHARQVRALAAASTESAARVAPAIVRLQMLAALREAWALRWPGLALGPATPDRGAHAAGGKPAENPWAHVGGIPWHCLDLSFRSALPRRTGALAWQVGGFRASVVASQQ